MSKEVGVVFHNDADGWGAAYAAWRRFGDAAAYYPHDIGDEWPVMGFHKELWIMELPPEHWMGAQAVVDADAVHVVDHHASAQAALDAWPRSPGRRVYFDVTQAACMLAWKTLHPMTKAPELLRYIEDRDLWKWEMPDSKVMNMGFSHVLEGMARQPVNEILERIHALVDAWSWDVAIADWRNQYQALVDHIEQVARRTAAKAVAVRIGGADAMAVNCPLYQSEVGHEILEEWPMVDVAACYWTRPDGRVQWSLRSRPESVDVGELCKTLGGGGHPCAAGFIAPVGVEFL